jgi:hypothetical protein
MGRSALAAAFLASLAVPLLRALAAREGGGFTGLGDELSLTALALLGWAALGGLPRTAGARPSAPPAAAVGLALPAAALGAALDLAAGRGGPLVLTTAAFGLLFLGVLCLAAEQGRGDAAMALAWWLSVPCLALLPAVARWGQGGAELAVGASPLGWLFLRAVEPPAAAEGASSPWPALAVAVSLWGLARLRTGSPRP